MLTNVQNISAIRLEYTVFHIRNIFVRENNGAALVFNVVYISRQDIQIPILTLFGFRNKYYFLAAM